MFAYILLWKFPIYWPFSFFFRSCKKAAFQEFFKKVTAFLHRKLLLTALELSTFSYNFLTLKNEYFFSLRSCTRFVMIWIIWEVLEKQILLFKSAACNKKLLFLKGPEVFKCLYFLSDFFNMVCSSKNSFLFV